MSGLQITLPRLVGTREAADELVSQAVGTPENGKAWVLGSALATSTISFADELITQLAARGANQILLVAGTPRFEKQMRDAAARHEPVDVRLATDDELAQI
jgi:methylmalonyl-CoA mutase cobalamin-binding subunit